MPPTDISIPLPSPPSFSALRPSGKSERRVAKIDHAVDDISLTPSLLLTLRPPAGKAEDEQARDQPEGTVITLVNSSTRLRACHFLFSGTRQIQRYL